MPGAPGGIEHVSPVGIGYRLLMPYLLDPVISAGAMSQSAQPTIVVDAELRLRPFTVADAPAVGAAFDDPDIQRWHVFRADSIGEAETWIENATKLWDDDKSAVWAIVDDADTVLGRCALHVDARSGNAEIAYWVLPEARGRGVAARSVTAATRWGHEALGVHRILLQHSVENLASCAVARRVGYLVEGTARLQGLHLDGRHDMHQHAHLSGDTLPAAVTVTADR